MITATKSIDIQAPVEKVFGYIADPAKGPEWMIGWTEVTEVTGSGVGQHYRWKYRMVGVPLHGESTVTEHLPNERIVTDSKGGITSTFAWTFAPRGDGTKLELKVDYTIPVPVLGKLAEKLVAKRNDREGDLWMENIKQLLEV